MLKLLALLIPLVSAEGDLKLLDFFSVEKTPGKGSLVYKQEGGNETIRLGEEHGLYGFGIVFSGDQLPETQRKELGGKLIIQVALGTLRNRLQAQVPQFASATFVTAEPIDKKATFVIKIPDGKPSKLKKAAFILYTPPNTPNEQSDEEKLKGTFFSQSGSVVVTPKGKMEAVQIKSQGSKYNFRVQTFVFDVNATLSTPFNAQERTLTGKIEFPVYVPFGDGAQELAKKLTTESFAALGPAPTHEGLSQHKRDIAGSTKKDTSPR